MARDLHAEALCWLRYVRRYPLVCTETGSPWFSDVVGVTETMFVEIEVKVSRSDLLAEFRNKETKHFCYDNVFKSIDHQSRGPGVPNYFFVLVPKALEKDALEILGEKAAWAGVLVHDDLGFIDGRNIRVAKRAKKLHDKPPSPRTLLNVQQRASSELCGLYIVREAYTKKLEVQGRVLMENALAAVARLEGYTPGEEGEAHGSHSLADQDSTAGQKDPLPDSHRE